MHKSIRLIAVSAALLVASCSSGEQSVAGGAGSGNPATVSMIARSAGATDSTGIAAARTADWQTSTVLPDSSFITVEDSGKMLLTITQISMRANAIHIPHPDGDTTHLIGPFWFDLLTGTVDGEKLNAGSLSLGSYRSLSFDPGVSIDTAQYEILLRGRFENAGETKTLAIFIHAPLSHTFYSADSIVLDGRDTAHLSVDLDDRQWLNGINIKGAYNNGRIFVDSTGLLVIHDTPDGTGPDGRLCGTIRDNIFGSGVLVRK